MFRRIVDQAVSLVAPPACLACGATIEGGRRICASCRARIERLPPGAPAADWCHACFAYEGPIRRLVAALKFEQAVAAADELALLMAPRLPLWMEPGSWLVPAPAHPARARERGYNQASLIAHALAEITGQRVVDCLRRDAQTRPQTELGRAERLALPAASIRVDARALRQRGGEALAGFPTKVVVCDDVTTTGVTLEVCAKALRERRPGPAQAEVRAVTVASTSAEAPGLRPHPTTRADRYAG